LDTAALQGAASGDDRPVALLPCALGDDLRVVPQLPELGYAGLVLEAFGGGHVPAPAVPALADLAARIPVVLASRTRGGEVLRETYGFPGSERDLIARGLVPAGFLDGPKARILLSLALAAGADVAGARTVFDRFLRSAVASPRPA
jgi:L-asparaginase